MENEGCEDCSLQLLEVTEVESNWGKLAQSEIHLVLCLSLLQEYMLPKGRSDVSYSISAPSTSTVFDIQKVSSICYSYS